MHLSLDKEIRKGYSAGLLHVINLSRFAILNSVICTVNAVLTELNIALSSDSRAINALLRDVN